MHSAARERNAHGEAIDSWTTALTSSRRKIRQAIERGGPGMHLQPIVDFARGRVAGYEALARFPGSSTPPDRWFARAMQIGLGGALEASAIRRALARRTDLPTDQFLSINVSPGALHEPEVREVLEGRSLEGVVIELTEHDQIGRRTELLDALDRLRDAGAVIAIDDIGTGYAGLEWVLAIRPDIVKLDQGFVQGVDRDPSKRALVGFVGDLSDQLDALLIAEGIEELGELDALVAMGVPLGQGYLLGTPHPHPQTLPGELRARIGVVRRGYTSDDDVVAGLVERPVWALVGGSTPAAGSYALLDEHGRCVGLHDDDAGRTLDGDLLRVKADDPRTAVVRRVLTRPAPRRWDPVLVVDDRGRHAGIIRVEHLVQSLLAKERS